MYKNAWKMPLGGFRYGGTSGSVDNGPTPEQLAGKARYEARLQAERDKQRALAVRRRPPQRAP